MIVHARIPEPVQPILKNFQALSEERLAGLIEAFYVVGSIVLACLPLRWHRLVQEAISIRQAEKDSSYRLRLGRMVEAVHLLKYMIIQCNE